MICVYSTQNNEEMNYRKISSKKIHFNKNNQQQKFDISYIILLDEFLDYVQQKQDDFNQIGFICYQYLQSQVDVVLKEFEKELLQLQDDIKQMIEFPVNLNNEIEVKQNVSQYLESLKTLISEICTVVNVDESLDKMVIGLLKALNDQRQKMLKCLNQIFEENSQFEHYLKINYKGKLPNEVVQQLLQFQFKLDESDFKVLQEISKYQYNYDVIKKTMLIMSINLKQWFEQFDLYLPQSLAYFGRIHHQKDNINLNKHYVIVLGMTKVGKSTLLNILNNPENIIITQDKKFDVKQKNSKILLSHKNTSQTFYTENVDIGQFIFVDTPGLRDTHGDNRVFNHLNIFNQINQVRDQFFLFMIDGELLSTNKNDLIDSIVQINLILGDQLDDQYLENIIIPTFTKIRDDFTMEQIITKWQTETMKDITDQKQLKILNIIKKAIDEQHYVKIYQAEHYEVHQELNKLELEIQQLKDEICELVEKGEESKEQQAKLRQKKKELEQLNKASLFEDKMIQIKQDILGKCENILERKKIALQGKSDINQKFEFKLSDEEQPLLNKLLAHRDKFYQQIVNIITNEFIAKMLFDNSMSIDEKFSVRYQIDDINLERIEDIPKVLISEKIQSQIEKLDRFNNNIKEHDKNEDPTKVDFMEFKKKFQFICEAFKNAASKHQILIYKWNEVIQFHKISLSIPNILITVPLVLLMAISAGNELFKNSLFVKQTEKEKEEKLQLIKIQQTYFTQFENKSK
ncbi:unnamed protein product (macronuclear) [Paramecium tetraurelia]|uniref:G domain-containing protein n=1 Tax=Paramecium tetraurelia TaxID=5888 RepID=A0BG68_PARTE|nr:uncharacterized protein GSPATT00028570001 [Paramecium tetraurelia]CAK57535.1 unnamed protein product [Paramecium tetraurelia]|eukprot:XP_001424933.1 hypothetical protein (macronuclear) [Paramecium tetraurelia strain d4-2]